MTAPDTRDDFPFSVSTMMSPAFASMMSIRTMPSLTSCSGITARADRPKLAYSAATLVAASSSCRKVRTLLVKGCRTSSALSLGISVMP